MPGSRGPGTEESLEICDVWYSLHQRCGLKLNLVLLQDRSQSVRLTKFGLGFVGYELMISVHLDGSSELHSAERFKPCKCNSLKYRSVGDDQKREV